ncbi:MAG: 4-(cytidine 5'-diphospho)-2-C-methyl-D-erythritol kinase [Clostridia bacterium]|nr:4-(cytidine 5'-diphospho)-2-C-methyl-D-erythritol kinase [Clostridia bacterium]
MHMKIKAHAKINWSLDILNRRDDGYHEMDMLMQQVELHDEIMISPSRFTTLTVNGKTVSNAGKNLIIRAANALNEYTGEKKSARIDLNKRIPVRAGLGGGSADCAAVLIALNEFWKLKIPFAGLLKIGEKLGADVPYCMTGGLCRVRGIGEIVESVTGAPSANLVIHAVGSGLSTQAVFSDFDISGDGALHVDTKAVQEAIVSENYIQAQNVTGNALERAAVRMLPEIENEIRALKDMGALYYAMSGSGSAVYGVFESEKDAKSASEKIPNSFVTKTIKAEEA